MCHLGTRALWPVDKPRKYLVGLSKVVYSFTDKLINEAVDSLKRLR